MLIDIEVLIELIKQTEWKYIFIATAILGLMYCIVLLMKGKLKND